jgi:hypothetical protein
MKATLLLCDAAQVDPAGKVHILGAGWTVVGVGSGAGLPGQAVVVMLHVPWNETVDMHFLRLRLEDADGNPVLLGPPGEQRALVHEQPFAAHRPAGAPEGISIDFPVVVSVGPGVTLAPGRYAWRLEIDGASHEDWMTSFHVIGPR